jgi:hypothetical protein
VLHAGSLNTPTADTAKTSESQPIHLTIGIGRDLHMLRTGADSSIASNPSLRKVTLPDAPRAADPHFRKGRPSWNTSIRQRSHWPDLAI